MPQRFTKAQLVRGPEPLGFVSGTEIRHLKPSFPDMLVDTQRTLQPLFLWTPLSASPVWFGKENRSLASRLLAFEAWPEFNDLVTATAFLTRSAFLAREAKRRRSPGLLCKRPKLTLATSRMGIRVSAKE
jgi:hypothetical protein